MLTVWYDHHSAVNCAKANITMQNVASLLLHELSHAKLDQVQTLRKLLPAK
jgi:hypothetical protein